MNTSGKTPPVPKFQLRLNWKLVLFSLLMLPVLISLGFWQLQRAEEKRNIQESWEKQQALPPVPLEELGDTSNSLYRRVSLTGHFVPQRYWLLENRVLNGQVGYEILMPFRLTAGADNSGPLIVVNRGWVPAGDYRTDVPQVTTPSGEVRISGSLITPGHNRLIQDPPADVASWPARVLQADLEVLAAQLKAAGVSQPFYQHVLQIEPASPGAFTTNWQPINTSPSKHTGYAVQWFTMAFALVVLTLFANSNLSDIVFKKRRTARPEQ